MGEEKFKVELTERQIELIINAIDAYEFVTSDVMTYDETMTRREEVIKPLYEQLPDRFF